MKQYAYLFAAALFGAVSAVGVGIWAQRPAGGGSVRPAESTGPGGDASGQRIHDSTGPLNLGAEATTTHSLTSGDVLVGGKFEVDDDAYFDDHVTLAGQLRLSNGQAAPCFGSSCGTGFTRFYADNSSDQFHLGLGSEQGRQFLIVDSPNLGQDYGVAVLTNPGLYVFSATAAASATDEWIAFSHNVTDGVVATGSGVLDLEPGAAGVELPGIIGTGAPSEPVACAAATAGVTTYVDDTDDSGAAQVCICFATGDDGAGNPTMDWRDLADPTGTACSFF